MKINQVIFNGFKKDIETIGNKIIIELSIKYKKDTKITDYKIATVWQLFRFIKDHNETYKDYFLSNKDIKDAHIETMILKCFKDLKFSI